MIAAGVALMVLLALPAVGHALSAVDVDGGDDSSCAVLRDGGVVCWGANGDGQLGNGTTTGSGVPVAVHGIDDAVQISVGYRTACALRDNGHIACWGDNVNGQLGNGTTTDSSVPVAVSSITDAVHVAAGTWTTCAVRSTGRVSCWGRGALGQLGNNSGTLRQTTPVNVVNSINDAHLDFTGDYRATKVSVGEAHVCARLVGGTVACWGSNADRQLANGTNAGWDYPRQALGVSGATDVTAGSRHSCATLADGTGKCWGAGADGQLGSGTRPTSTVTPLVVSGLTGATAIASGSSFTNCTIVAGGQVRCWGGNYNGQLGIGTDGGGTSSDVPVTTLDIAAVTRIGTGGSHSCALIDDGGVKCWGYALGGRVGNGEVGFVNAPRPVTVIGFEDPVAPETSITSGPSGITPRTTAVFTFGADESATFECSLDGAAYSACSSPLTLTGLSAGAHTFAVRATDAASNVDLTPASRTWTVQPTAATDAVAGDLPAGGSLASAPVDADVGPAAGVAVSLTTPVAGPVSLASAPIATSPPAGFSFLGNELVITAPTATAANPLILVLRVDSAAVPAGFAPLTVDAFRNGQRVEACTGAGATPDPCLAERRIDGDDLVLTVRTSRASTWNLGVAAPRTDAAEGADLVAAPGVRDATSLRVLSVRSGRSTILLRTRVSGAGVVRVTGTSAGRVACRGVARPSRAGVVVLRCRLQPAVRAMRGDGPVRVRLRVRFAPADGAVRAVTRTVTLPRLGAAQAVTG